MNILLIKYYSWYGNEASSLYRQFLIDTVETISTEWVYSSETIPSIGEYVICETRVVSSDTGFHLAII